MHVKMVEKPWRPQRASAPSLCSGGGDAASDVSCAEAAAPLSTTASNASHAIDVRTREQLLR